MQQSVSLITLGVSDYERAKKQLLTTIRWLERLNPDAANSLREGMEETLTVVKLGLPVTPLVTSVSLFLNPE